MSESKKHMDLVIIAYNWIRDSLSEQYRSFVEVDTPETIQTNYVETFRPDVYYNFNNQLYIGEAKTIKDFDRDHSKKQYEAYIKRCDNYEGTSCFVISIPWELTNSAKNYFRIYKEKNSIKVPVVILTDLKTEYRV